MSSFQHEKIVRETPGLSWLMVLASFATYTLVQVKPEFVVMFIPTTTSGFFAGIFFPGFRLS